jgi:hypothetical protein
MQPSQNSTPGRAGDRLLLPGQPTADVRIRDDQSSRSKARDIANRLAGWGLDHLRRSQFAIIIAPVDPRSVVVHEPALRPLLPDRARMVRIWRVRSPHEEGSGG